MCRENSLLARLNSGKYWLRITAVFRKLERTLGNQRSETLSWYERRTDTGATEYEIRVVLRIEDDENARTIFQALVLVKIFCKVLCTLLAH